MPVVANKKDNKHACVIKKKKRERKIDRKISAKKKKDASRKKEQGHLFVPSSVAKSLTEAILNDIGESLQSEQLQGVRGRRKKESKER